MIKCTFCSEKEATTKILDPNNDTEDWWDVCEYCDKFIKEKQKEAFQAIIEDHKMKFLNSDGGRNG